jgi:choline kinase
MRAVILAAGRGSRMKEMTSSQPKCLIRIQGKSLLERQIESLNGAGISEIAIVTGHYGHLLKGRTSETFHNPRWHATNMVTSLECASEWLSQHTCVVSYSDIFYSKVAIDLLMRCDEHIGILYSVNWLELWTKRFGNPLLDAESFSFNDLGYVTEIGKSPNSVEEIQGQYMGLIYLTPCGWNQMKLALSQFAESERDKLSMTHLLQRIIDNGTMPVMAIPYSGEWGEVDSESDLKIYEKQ